MTDAWQNSDGDKNARGDEGWGNNNARSPSPVGRNGNGPAASGGERNGAAMDLDRDTRRENGRRSRSRSPGRGRGGGGGGGSGSGGGGGGGGGGGADGGTNPGNNLHVTGLSSKVGNRDLEEVFGKLGKVAKAAVMFDPHTRESRGFGFVTMETVEGAEAAVASLNATELLGKTMSVEKARRGRARTPTPGRYYGPPKRDTLSKDERPYDPRPYDSRYSYDRPRHDDRHSSRGGYDDRYGGRRDDYDRRGGGGRYDDRRYDDRRYDDRRY